MQAQFEGKKLLVVGGSSGMGLETARLVMQQGGSAVIVGSQADKVEAARQKLAPPGRPLSTRIRLVTLASARPRDR